MIFSANDRRPSAVEKAQGGEGQVIGAHWLTADNRPAGTHFKMAAAMTLPKGSSIGFHLHNDDEEIYLITGGRGLFTDHDGRQYSVGPGDLMLTFKGQGHALANAGDEPLTFSAVIAAQIGG